MSTPPSSSFEPIQLRVGARHELRLRGLGTSGYRWSFAIEDGVGVADVERVATSKPLGGQFPTGESAEEVFSIRALSPGRARVRFGLQRPWLVGRVPPIEEHVLEVDVLQ